MTAVRPESTDVETGRWYTYHFTAVRDLRCGLRGCTERHEVLYVGKSNEPWRRHFEHLKDKGWIRYASGYTIHERTYATEAECLAAERALIREWQPLANEQHNKDNPHRLVFAKVGDDARPARPRARRSAQRAVVSRRRSGGWLVSRSAGYVYLWLVLAAGGCWAAVEAVAATVVDGAKFGAVAASVLFVFALGRRKPKRRRSRRRR
jgi:predicted GIY-YIG superfamily endonuclease